ncbi:MAG: chaperone NapD [Desulfobulbus sp.]|jgi:nitrate reductase NapAB chaperone NapD|uniref:chaperone NapD n=1 Tax=Desulfobulbus sp. TaxID=895 RepID=UPI00284BB75C|nr:chaperone NapD [Desulfobulbus sp.]MDR2549913.1 chaperone NapD [Desulfobulbus sp.]
MPISGVVITTRPEDLHQTRQFLATCAGVEVHGADDRGNIVAVFDTRTGEEMERLLKTVNACPQVLHAGITYINMEDVVVDEGLDSKATP